MGNETGTGTSMLEVNFEQARLQMVDHQVRGWAVLDPAVNAVMERLPRERFTPDRYRNLAYADSEIPIGHGQIMLRPSIQGRLLQAAQIRSGERVLEIGTGTGYLTACLAALGGEVRSAEIHEELAHIARKNLAAEGFASVEVVREDLHTLAEEGPEYDAILVTGSLPAPDPAFARRLGVGGRLVWIVGSEPAMHAQRVIRVAPQEWSHEGLFELVVPPLEGVASLRRFEL